ncbi:DUF3995 domain-containing protein [Egibacter rhizosphaerae]|uniref:DUF3995 domain-containing protein n=1 Tax=Egibacter rhizosphaerae TaxID=1670831 RepID=A0A411YBB3_9ACTN|nr:DUF3995 domain-containing protein [Egibacter rhizosphaerae]QBI18490.1 DUF3995 domain-containing protein [Egibacter rhizosphaerae]
MGRGLREQQRRALPAIDRWAGYAAAFWAAAFGIRSLYWALGGTVGLGTISEGLQAAAAARDPGVLAALWWVTVMLAVGTVLGLALVRAWGAVFPRVLPGVGGQAVPPAFLLLPSCGAGALLAAHGGQYLSFLVTVDPLEGEAWWYGVVWGPWFALGGILFLLASWSYLRRRGGGTLAVVASFLGVAGGLLAAFAPQIIGLLVGAFVG